MGATLTAYSQLTLAEVQKREGYDDMAAVLGELGQMNDLIREAPWYPATHGTYNKALLASRLGTGGFSEVNGPVSTISSQAEEITEPVKLYEGDSKIDERLLNGSNDPYAVRDSEDALNLEGFMQDWTYQCLYANEGTTPNAFKSLARRRASLGDYCRGVGGTGADLTSLWMFEFGPRGFHFAYAPGGMPGIKNEDRGRHTVAAPTGTGNYWAWIRHYEIWAALVLRNERALQRLANIETSGSSNNLIASMNEFIAAKNQLPTMGQNAVAFANRTLRGQIDIAAFNKANVWLSVREYEGYGPITMIAGIPVRTIEQILDTESALT